MYKISIKSKKQKQRGRETGIMNIQDIPKQEQQNGAYDKLILIYEHQKELIKKYHPIEKANGLLIHNTVPVEIDSSTGQYRIKDFLWRVTEELMEARESYIKHETMHTHEELADVCHFFIELLIICDIQPKDLIRKTSSSPSDYLDELFGDIFSTNLGLFQVTFDEIVLDIVYYLGMAGNCLKQKPWKQSHQITDKIKFKQKIKLGFQSFILLCLKENLTAEDLYSLYFKKNQVNQFRIKSNY